MYWTTLSLFLLVESWLYFILYWVPFYAWIRLGIHLYLVLPGKQGSVFIYQEYVHPFLEDHERQIDRMISEAHARAKDAGLDVFKNVWEYVRVQVLGQPPSQPSPQPSRNVSYSTFLFDRFAMPSARQGLAAAGVPTGDNIFNLIGKALQQNTYPTSTTTQSQAADLAQSGALIPPTLRGEERSNFITTQQERLQTLLQSLNAEASGATTLPPSQAGARGFDTREVEPEDYYTTSSHPRSSMPRQPSSRKSYLVPGEEGHMHKSRSESEFEDLAYESMPDPDTFRMPPAGSTREASGGGQGAKAGGGWSNWIWGSYGEPDSAIGPRKND
jgi:hypothetical protein